MVFVFAHQSPFYTIFNRCPILPDSADVYKQSCLCINPPRINDVQFIVRPADHVMWIDLKQVVPAGGKAWEGKMVLGHVVVSGKKVDRFFGDLKVKVRVPRKYLQVYASASPLFMSRGS